ncbi:hypothetical protein ADL19_05620 [Streptomyces purpurogeneiscleroticus]|nr:hypothetical protein ADL19_05620 [Streptomyces purpurogeneiscleroticus]
MLAALRGDDRAKLAIDLTRVPHLHGEVLFDPGERPDHVYFPLIGMVSFVALMDDGGAVGQLAEALDKNLRELRRLVGAHLLTSTEDTAALDQLDRLVSEVRRVIGMVEVFPVETPPS